MSPDGLTPPVPVASSSPLPLLAEAELEDEETEEIVNQEGEVSPLPGPATPVLSVTPTAPSKSPSGRKGFSPNTEKAKRRLEFTKPTKKRVSTTKKAGLVLSVTRIKKRMKAGRYCQEL